MLWLMFVPSSPYPELITINRMTEPDIPQTYTANINMYSNGENISCSPFRKAVILGYGAGMVEFMISGVRIGLWSSGHRLMVRGVSSVFVFGFVCWCKPMSDAKQN